MVRLGSLLLVVMPSGSMKVVIGYVSRCNGGFSSPCELDHVFLAIFVRMFSLRILVVTNRMRFYIVGSCTVKCFFFFFSAVPARVCKRKLDAFLIVV